VQPKPNVYYIQKRVSSKAQKRRSRSNIHANRRPRSKQVKGHKARVQGVFQKKHNVTKRKKQQSLNDRKKE
jgi:hypothetical protein